MEFLYRLYSNNYFGIGLFIVITILAFSFLVILFFGKKDEKNRNKENRLEETMLNSPIEESNELEEAKIYNEAMVVDEKLQETIYENTEENTENEYRANNEDVLDQTKEEVFNFSNPSVANDFSSLEQPKVETIKENDYSNSLFLEDREINELDTIEESSPLVMEEEMLNEEDYELPIIEEMPLFEEQEEPNIFSENNEEIDNKKVSVAPIFSSVYLNKEEPTQEEDEVAPKPIKPEFELPKTIDLPKRNTNHDDNDNIIKF